MGCPISKLDDGKVVQLCKDRKKFIKQAAENRTKFASAHHAYIQSMKRISVAIEEYVDREESLDFMLDPCQTPSFNLFGKIPNTSSIKPEIDPSCEKNYLRSVGTPSITVEERPPQPPEIIRIQTFSPVHHLETDCTLPVQASAVKFSDPCYSTENRLDYPMPPPEAPSQWDFFWDPFSSLDYYRYLTGSSLDQSVPGDENVGLRQPREVEGPKLEDTTVEKEVDDKVNKKQHEGKLDVSSSSNKGDAIDTGTEMEHKAKESQPPEELKEVSESTKVSEAEIDSHSSAETIVVDCETKVETPRFTVYVNQMPSSMAEAFKNVKNQFNIACTSASEVSTILEASGSVSLSISNDITVMNMLNPVSLFRSASSWSLSRFSVVPSMATDEGYESSSDFPEDSCMLPGSHQSTLERLYAWEKKLFHEIKAGERVRVAYQKKLSQLRNGDVKGETPSSVDKTRANVEDLYAQLKVSMHSVDAVLRRIEALREKELEPQLFELIQGLAKMWRLLAESHQLQKHDLDEGKVLLAAMHAKTSETNTSRTELPHAKLHQLANSAANLEMEIRNWRACFESWIVSQRSYVHALTGWLMRCVPVDPDISNLQFSPCRSVKASPVLELCTQWSSFLDSVQEASVLNGMDCFEARVRSLRSQVRLKLEANQNKGSSRRIGNTSVAVRTDEGRLEEAISEEKMAEIATRVLCGGMSAPVDSLLEFATSAASGYANLVKELGNTKVSEQVER